MDFFAAKAMSFRDEGFGVEAFGADLTGGFDGALGISTPKIVVEYARCLERGQRA